MIKKKEMCHKWLTHLLLLDVEFAFACTHLTANLTSSSSLAFGRANDMNKIHVLCFTLT